MTEITPELKALADAALELGLACKNGKFEVTIPAQTKFMKAYDAYRATQAPPRECRSPDGVMYVSYWYMTRREAWTVAEWADPDEWLFMAEDQGISPKSAAKSGWTVHSPCIFPGTGEVATEGLVETVARVLAKQDGKNPDAGDDNCRDGRPLWCAYRIRALEIVNIQNLPWFHAPKLREISDEEILRICHANGMYSNNKKDTLKSARAIISYVAEGEK